MCCVDPDAGKTEGIPNLFIRSVGANRSGRTARVPLFIAGISRNRFTKSDELSDIVPSSFLACSKRVADERRHDCSFLPALGYVKVGFKTDPLSRVRFGSLQGKGLVKRS